MKLATKSRRGEDELDSRWQEPSPPDGGASKRMVKTSIRRAYEPPRVRCFGTVVDLTLFSGSQGVDSGGMIGDEQ